MLRGGQGTDCGSVGERRGFSPQNGRLAADGLHAFAEQVDVNGWSRDVVMRIAVVGNRPRRRASGPRARPELHGVDGLDRVIVDLDLIGRQPVARELQRQQATGRDDRLLRLGVHPRQPGASPRPYWLGDLTLSGSRSIPAPAG